MNAFVRVVLVALVCSITACASHHQTLTPNSEPDISLRDLSGKSHQLREYRGRYVLLHFWASWCIPCTFELPRMQHLQNQISDHKLLVVSIAVQDQTTDAQEIAQRHRLRFPVLLDRSGATREVFGLSGLPKTILLDPDGKIIPFPDPASLRLVSQVDGAREWDRSAFVKIFIEFLNTQNRLRQ